MIDSRISADEKRHVVILGGGVGAIVSAYALTSQPNWKEKYDVSVYTLGWRLGGKGASSRVSSSQMLSGSVESEQKERHNARIEEHGLHVWMGFYENAFHAMRGCYKELGREENAPLATWKDAFAKHSLITLTNLDKKEWEFWQYPFPDNEEEPGDGHELPSVWSYFEMFVELIVDQFVSLEEKLNPGSEVYQGCNQLMAWMSSSCQELQGKSLKYAFGLIKRLPPSLSHLIFPSYRFLLSTIEAMLTRLEQLWGAASQEDPEVEKFFSMMNLGVSLLQGMLEERVMEKGFDSIDQYDLREWLSKYGLKDPQNPIVKGMYSLLFSYPDGKYEEASLAAGVGLRFMLRMSMTYKGAVFWKMQAGMGETVFSPFYEVLKKRGVNFHFFHRVDKLEVDPQTKMITQIKMTNQVKLKSGAYEPLIDVDGLPCWPEEPLWDQIEDGSVLRDELAERKLRQDSRWAPKWKDAEEVVLACNTAKTVDRKEGFDQLVLGISIGALPEICTELSEHNEHWKKMFQQIQTNQIQSAQLWFDHSLHELGWRHPSTVLTNFEEPLNTYADMSHLIPVERWPKDGRTKSLAYFCGPMRQNPIYPPEYHNYPESQRLVVRQITIDWIEEHARLIWPRSVDEETGEFAWNLLVDPLERQGSERIDAQVYKANVEPSDRYVLALPGSTSARLHAAKSGFKNLFLAGDWTHNGLNCGCVESATMSGLQAARGICGYPIRIFGETDF